MAHGAENWYKFSAIIGVACQWLLKHHSYINFIILTHREKEYNVEKHSDFAFIYIYYNNWLI